MKTEATEALPICWLLKYLAGLPLSMLPYTGGGWGMGFDSSHFPVSGFASSGSAALAFLPRFGFGCSSSSAALPLLLGHIRNEPDLRCFSSRYGLPHFGQVSATGL